MSADTLAPPRVRGDEPRLGNNSRRSPDMLPAHAGLPFLVCWLTTFQAIMEELFASYCQDAGEDATLNGWTT